MRVPRWLLIPSLIVMVLFWTQDYWKQDAAATIFDLPKTLEEKAYTIDVYQVRNLNGVMVFSTGTGGNEDDYLYLTPASDSVDFPADFASKKDSGYVLQVHGKFYMGKGIPAAYFDVKPKPERYRVFQFDNAAMVAENKRM